MIGEQELMAQLQGCLSQIGYELVSLKMNKGKDGWTLSIVVDRPSPISLDDIVGVSDVLSKRLDEIDPIEEGYMLDVSSLGAEKPIGLTRLEEYVGSYVNLHLSHPYKGENTLEGTLLSVNNDEVRLQVAVKARKVTVSLPRGDIDRARLAISF